MELSIVPFILIGFLAQVVDGALGMGYGVISTSFLLSLGVPPAIASASVHTAEVFVTGASGLAHLGNGNVERRLVLRLIIPGVLGGILGAYVLTQVPGEKIRLVVAVYLFATGVLILCRALGRRVSGAGRPRLIPLGFAGGFLDSVGGGGWGPIVTSTLVAQGQTPRLAIGSVSLTEFFVTLAQAVTFLVVLRWVHWPVAIGLLIGGVLAAPLAAYMCRRLPARVLMGLVGVLILVLSLRTIYRAVS
ncbi:MAG: sulfite exporter TauE/SafE family protein [Blastocatellia bacterium]|nr:sulfite exporter TauE/SafE family protein [Blastocatellia bacterium]MCS7157016.1 sulfite exporter TauE/SafE family protein [Blastocatellia bacterium]MCX7752217.1 sulfite exporter TauE/SafE family protein [Blastocatellia bacterium]